MNSDYTGAQIDQRLKQNYYDDVVAMGYTGSKDQLDEALKNLGMGTGGPTFKIAGQKDSEAQLIADIPDGSDIDGWYVVGTSEPYDYYAWIEGAWSNQGQIKGANGDDGQSAYQVWLSLGNSGTEQDFIDSLRISQAELDARVLKSGDSMTGTLKMDNGSDIILDYNDTNPSMVLGEDALGRTFNLVGLRVYDGEDQAEFGSTSSQFNANSSHVPTIDMPLSVDLDAEYNIDIPDTKHRFVIDSWLISSYYNRAQVDALISAGGGGGNYIPITGTTDSNPVSGHIELANGAGLRLNDTSYILPIGDGLGSIGYPNMRIGSGAFGSLYSNQIGSAQEPTLTLWANVIMLNGSNLDARISTIENTIGTLNEQLEARLNGE